MNFGPYILKIPNGYQTGGIDLIWSLVRFAISALLTLGFIASLIFLIIGGIKWMTSGGEKQAVASARSTITSALVGLVLLIVGFLVVGYLQVQFNVNLGLTPSSSTLCQGGTCYTGTR